MSCSLIIYKEPYTVKFFLIPDKKINEEQRKLFRFANQMGDPENSDFNNPEEERDSKYKKFEEASKLVDSSIDQTVAVFEKYEIESGSPMDKFITEFYIWQFQI